MLFPPSDALDHPRYKNPKHTSNYNPLALPFGLLYSEQQLTYVQIAASQAELAKAKASAESYSKDAEAYARDAKAATLKKVDEFDKTVEAKAAQAKSGVSSWFGGK